MNIGDFQVIVWTVRARLSLQLLLAHEILIKRVKGGIQIRSKEHKAAALTKKFSARLTATFKHCINLHSSTDIIRELAGKVLH